MPPIIELRGASKAYKQYAHPARRLQELITGRARFDAFTALHAIDLTIDRGETVGVMGRNGSGKSTLLRLIAGILAPSSGSVNVHGRLSTLLELGSGFNPEFTGRENVYFAGSLAGLSRADVDRRFTEIADFAEIGDFIDRAVRTYSSGMFVRLAFAVAVHLQPEIMLIDEALAVGDVFFQQKCFQRLREMRDSGVTLLFVSHDSTSIQRLCTRAILLDGGHVRLDGRPAPVIAAYEANALREADAEPVVHEEPPVAHAELAHLPDLLDLDAAQVIERLEDLKYWDLSILNSAGTQTVAAVSGESITVRASVTFQRRFEDPHVGFRIRDRFGVIVYETNTHVQNISLGAIEAGAELSVDFLFELRLAPGEYTITLGIADGGAGTIFRHTVLFQPSAARLTVLRDTTRGIWNGVIDLRPEIFHSRRSRISS